MNRQDNRGCSLTSSRLSVGVEKSARKDVDLLLHWRWIRCGSQNVQQSPLAEGDWKGMNGEVDFVGGNAEGQPRRDSNREGGVEVGREEGKVGSERSGGGGSVTDKEADRASLVNLGGDCEGEGTVCIPKDAGSNVWAGGGNQGGLVVFRGGRARSVESSFCRGEPLGGWDSRHRVADRPNLSCNAEAFLVNTLVRGDSHGSLSIGLLWFEAVRVRMAQNK